MSVGEFCSRNVVVTDVTTDVQEAASLMRKFHVGDVVIIDDQNGLNVPIGIVTDRDLVLEVLAQDISPDNITVCDVMSENIHSMQQNEDLFDALYLMAEKGIRRIPIINDEGGLEGILTLDDLLEVFAEKFSCLVKSLSKEQQVEKIQRN